MTRVVVAFPVFNGAKTLHKSLQCIADQDFPNFRAIIVENCSTDDSLAIAQAFCKNDHRFEVIRNVKHLSATENFTRCIELASGSAEYFCLRACDDYSSSDFLSKLVEALDADPSKLLAVGATLRVGEQRESWHRPSSAVLNFAELVQRGRIPRNLTFPSEWFYGVYRSSSAPEILLRRWTGLGSAWCAASYAVTEFVVRGLVAYDSRVTFHFSLGSPSIKMFSSLSLRDKLAHRWRYTIGCYRVHPKIDVNLPKLIRLRLFLMFWNDARRKTGYYILGFL